MQGTGERKEGLRLGRTLVCVPKVQTATAGCSENLFSVRTSGWGALSTTVPAPRFSLPSRQPGTRCGLGAHTVPIGAPMGRDLGTPRLRVPKPASLPARDPCPPTSPGTRRKPPSQPATLGAQPMAPCGSPSGNLRRAARPLPSGSLRPQPRRGPGLQGGLRLSALRSHRGSLRLSPLQCSLLSLFLGG